MERRPLRESPLPMRLVTLFIAVLLVTAMVVLILYFVNLTIRPFEYTEREVSPTHAELCPGESLVFHYTVHVRKAPFAVAIVENLRRVEDGKSTLVWRDKSPAWTIAFYNGEQTLERTYELSKLPPGDYEYVRGALSGRTLADYFIVKFKIKEC